MPRKPTHRIILVSTTDKKNPNPYGVCIAKWVISDRLGDTPRPGVAVPKARCGWDAGVRYAEAAHAVRALLNRRFGVGGWVEAQFDESGRIIRAEGK